MRRAALALIVLVGLVASSAWGSGDGVRAATPAEGAAISRGVQWAWSYESTVPSDMPHVPRSHDRVRVLAMRVSRTVPAFASVAAELVTPGGDPVPSSRAIVLLERQHGSWSSFGEPDVIGMPAAGFPVACTQATPAGLRDLLCPNPWAILSVSGPPGPQSYDMPVRTDDLRKVDWADVALPGSPCEIPGMIRLKNQGATVIGPTDGWWSVVDVGLTGLSQIRYGQLGSAGLRVALVPATCNNGGGTADGQLNFFDVVFSASDERLHVIGVITPRQPLEPFTPHVPLLATASLRNGEIVVPEDWYGPDDGTAGGSGLATTTWAYAHERLRVVRTVIREQPKGAHE